MRNPDLAKVAQRQSLAEQSLALTEVTNRGLSKRCSSWL
jgi:hypothetical protein